MGGERLDERSGTALLKRRFEAAGLRIEEDFPLREGPVDFRVDGFDPGRRIGYEYLTPEAGDREEVTPAMVRAIEERMKAGDLHVLLIDESEAPTEDLLLFAADRFLYALRSRGRLP